MKVFAIDTVNCFAIGADDVDVKQRCFLYTSQHGTFFIGNHEGDVCVTAHETDMCPNEDWANTKRYHPDDVPTWSQWSKIARVVGSPNVVEVFTTQTRRVLRGWMSEREFIFSFIDNGGKRITALLPNDKVRALRPKDMGLNRGWAKCLPFKPQI